MAKRYVPNDPFVAWDKKGRRRTFVPNRQYKDGTTGYAKDELKDLYPDQLASFRVVEVAGKGVIDASEVEEATSEPGKKRTVTRKTATPNPQESDEQEAEPEPDTEG